jgi:hypothetical protein
MSEPQHDQDPVRIARIVDMRIPLWGVITATATGAFLLVSMYFTTEQTAKNVTELQITVKAGNTQVNSLAGEQALLKFRQENVESELRILKDVLTKQSLGRGHDVSPR